MRLLLGVLLITLPLWNARRDLQRAVNNGFPAFVQRNHIYPIYDRDKAIRDALKILNRVEEDAIVFTNWDKLYSYVYTAHIENGRTEISFHEWLTDDPVLSRSAVDYMDAVIDERPIYFAIDRPQLPESFRIEKINESLYRIHRN
jgi:hypothetical protein